MVGGGSGVHLVTVPEVVEGEFSWQEDSATTLSLKTEANTATAFVSSTVPVTSALVLTQVR